MRILISAYACSPCKGSEPGVGWGFVAELAKHHDLWVIVEEEKYRGDIERFLHENHWFSDSVHFFFLHKKRNRLLRKLWPPSYYWYYRRWHWHAYKLAQWLHAEIGFDLVHQLTMVGFREPGYLWKLGIPFVWGPIGGLGYFPWRFLFVFGFKGTAYYLFYNIINFLHSHFLKRPRSAAKAAGTGLLAATLDNQARALVYWGCRSTIVSEVGLPSNVKGAVMQRKHDAPLRLVWAGQHKRGKALNIGLLAMGRISPKIDWNIQILGQGEMTEKWKRLSKQLQIDDRCFFHGWKERNKALEIMATCHVMLITSLRDLTSTVTIEALALGLPIICLDHCGFSHVVNESCGIKIPVTTPKRVIRELAAAVERLAQDEPLRQQLSAGALQRAQDFTWEKKIEVVNRIYGARVQEARVADTECE